MGSYQRLDLFNKLLRVLCPNLPDASKKREYGVWQSSDGSSRKMPLDSSAFLYIGIFRYLKDFP